MTDSTVRFVSMLSVLARFALALAIAYLAYALLQIGRQVPELLQQVDSVVRQSQVSLEQMEPVLESVPLIVDESREYRALVPEVLEEARAYRELVPQALDEVAAVREALPTVIQRVDRMQDQIDQLQKTLPVILKTVEDTNQVVADSNRQIEKVIPLVPQVLEQVELTRGDIPVYLTRVENIVADAGQMTEDVGKNAFTGFVKGVFSSPFDLMRGLGSSLRAGLETQQKFTESDMQMVVEVSREVLSSGTAGQRQWVNEETGNSGSVQLSQSYMVKGQTCHDLNLLFEAKSGSSEKLKRTVCRNEDNQWIELK